jgi:small subunit ribosomal protein S16
MRLGRKGQPFYRIVAVDSRKRRDGAYIEKIGHYNPNARPAELTMDDEKALKWLHNGAVPSDTVRSLLSRHGVMLAFDLARRGLSDEEITSRVAAHRQASESKLKAKDAVTKPSTASKPAVTVEVQPEPEKEITVEAQAQAPESSTPNESENTPTE